MREGREKKVKQISQEEAEEVLHDVYFREKGSRRTLIFCKIKTKKSDSMNINQTR